MPTNISLYQGEPNPKDIRLRDPQAFGSSQVTDVFVSPQIPVRRPWAVAVYALSLAFVPVVAATTVTAAQGTQGGAPPLVRSLRQYQALSGPVFVPAGAAETITLDKWHSPAVVPVARVRRPSGETVAPVTVPAAGETITSDKWAGTYPDRAPAARRAPQGGSVAPLYVPDVTVAVPPLSWQPTQPARLNRRPSPVSDSTVGPVVVAAPGETITSDKWAGSYPDRVPAARRAPTGGAVAPLYVPDVTVVAPPLSWQASAADRPTRRPTPVYDSTVAPVSAQAPAETITLDKWAGNPPEPLRRAWRPQGGVVAPLYVPDVTVAAPPLSWLGNGTARPSARVSAPYDSTVEPVTTAAPAEVVTLDKWHSPAVSVVRAVRRQPGGSVSPLYLADVTVVPPLLSWSPIAPAIVPRLRVLRPLGSVVANVEPILYSASYRYIVTVPFEQRRIAVPRESRIVAVEYESRAVVVRHEDRTAIVPQQPRTAAQED